jgi:DnaK suppressor protein
MLTPAERAEIRSLLESEIETLEAEIASMRVQTQPVSPDSSIGRVTRMDNLVNMGTVELALNEAAKRLERLRDKLDRINSPEFGVCGKCGEPISMDRLRVAPDRGVCVRCLNESKAGKR